MASACPGGHDAAGDSRRYLPSMNCGGPIVRWREFTVIGPGHRHGGPGCTESVRRRIMEEHCDDIAALLHGLLG